MQLLLTRSDNTEARLQLRQHPRDCYITIVPEGVASSSGYATEQPLQAPPRPAPIREPSMPEGVAFSSSAVPPQSLGELIRGLEAAPKSIRALQAGRFSEADGHVLEAHMKRGYELEAIRQEAQQSWNSELDLVVGTEESSAAEEETAASGGHATEQPVHQDAIDAMD